MIDDGPQFKLLLSRSVKRFELDLVAWPRPPERAGEGWDSYWQCRFEDVLFRVGLGTRKLIEAAKLSIEVQAQPVDVRFAPIRSPRLPDTHNYHQVEEFYDVEAGSTIQLPLVTLCHAIVHSFVLVPRFTYSGVTGLRLESFFLASDRGRRAGVYVVEWRHFTEQVVRPVVDDDVSGMVSFRTGQGEEIRIPLANADLTHTNRGRMLDQYKKLSKYHAKAVKQFAADWESTWGFPWPDQP